MGIVKNNSLSWESTLPPVEPLPPGPINPFDNKLTDEFSCAVVPLTASPGPLSVKPVPEEGTNVSEPAVIGSAETVAVVRKQTAKRTAATMGDLMDSMRTPGYELYDRTATCLQDNKRTVFSTKELGVEANLSSTMA